MSAAKPSRSDIAAAIEQATLHGGEVVISVRIPIHPLAQYRLSHLERAIVEELLLAHDPITLPALRELVEKRIGPVAEGQMKIMLARLTEPDVKILETYRRRGYRVTDEFRQEVQGCASSVVVGCDRTT